MATVEMIIDSIRQELLYYQWVVTLREESGERYFPIYIGLAQGELIRSLLMDTKVTEPVGLGLSVPDVDINTAELQSVVINRLKDNVFYAQLLLVSDVNNGHESSSYCH